MKDQEPKRCQKEVFPFLNFPDGFFRDLENHCIPFNEKMLQDPEKKYLELNRLESYLLKPIIPFIRIGHLPRGRYFKVMGDLIMITADVAETLQTILPVPQNFVPVALKRKIQYSVYFIQEFVD